MYYLVESYRYSITSASKTLKNPNVLYVGVEAKQRAQEKLVNYYHDDQETVPKQQVHNNTSLKKMSMYATGSFRHKRSRQKQKQSHTNVTKSKNKNYKKPHPAISKIQSYYDKQKKVLNALAYESVLRILLFGCLLMFFSFNARSQKFLAQQKDLIANWNLGPDDLWCRYCGVCLSDMKFLWTLIEMCSWPIAFLLGVLSLYASKILHVYYFNCTF